MPAYLWPKGAVCCPQVLSAPVHVQNLSASAPTTNTVAQPPPAISEHLCGHDSNGSGGQPSHLTWSPP